MMRAKILCTLAAMLTACEQSTVAETCFFYAKNLDQYTDENFDAIGDAIWENPEFQALALHHSGSYLFVESSCNIRSMQDLTTAFEVPFIEGQSYEFAQISQKDFESFRKGEKPYP